MTMKSYCLSVGAIIRGVVENCFESSVKRSEARIVGRERRDGLEHGIEMRRDIYGIAERDAERYQLHRM